jgi:aryl-alcohol dehydrogenase-like predicted oxidoreductase
MTPTPSEGTTASRTLLGVLLTARGDAVDIDHGINLIRDAHDLGVTLFDTAEAYGPFQRRA